MLRKATRASYRTAKVCIVILPIRCEVLLESVGVAVPAPETRAVYKVERIYPMVRERVRRMERAQAREREREREE